MSKLPNAPLQEVIFEVRWKLDIDPSTGSMMDKEFELTGGQLKNLLREEYPVYKRRFSEVIPYQQLSYQIIHQFWKGDNTWPVVQLGPGIFTVNDTEKNYDWEKTFLPLIQQGMEWLFQSYTVEPEINSCSLKYIDSVNIKSYLATKALSDFLSENLKISVENRFDTKGKQEHLFLNQFFQLKNGDDFILTIQDANDNQTGDPVLVWQTAVIHKIKIDKSDIIDWVQTAHRITSGLFKEMTKGRFYDSFSQAGHH